MFRSRAQLIGWRLENGQAIEARVLVSFYEPRGEFQLNVEAVRQAGSGTLFERFLQLKQKLDGEGLFDAARKRELPPYPLRIGIVTSPQAAALRDVVSTLRRRAPHVALTLYPAPVQGPDAAAQLAAMVEAANARAECDLLIVCRGGGSLEDLWSFNQEVLARAIAASVLPVISGVGHETDFTIADFVADLRAPTPTAAAELAAPATADLHRQLRVAQDQLRGSLRRRLREHSQRLDYLGRRLRHPREQIALARERLGLMHGRFQRAANTRQEQARTRVGALATQLRRTRPALEKSAEAVDRLRLSLHRAGRTHHERLRQHLDRLANSMRQLDPTAVLDRGYAIVRRHDGFIIKNSTDTKPGDRIVVHVAHGEFEADVSATRQAAQPDSS
jgi:exodeoxyribonuclease VII large subunit